MTHEEAKKLARHINRDQDVKGSERVRVAKPFQYGLPSSDEWRVECQHYNLDGELAWTEEITEYDPARTGELWES